MHIAFLNPQGNFDPEDRYWTAHPDFGGQLVYVKELSLALGRMGHRVDILTRRVVDPEWIGFEADQDGYPGEPNVRILRLPCGGDKFLPKQDFWPVLGSEWLPNIQAFYAAEGREPDTATSHYGDGGLAATLWRRRGGPPFTFTAHSLGAHKLARLLEDERQSLGQLDAYYHFTQRIIAERLAMHYAGRVLTSTEQERREQYAHPAYRGAIDVSDDTRFSVVPPGVNLHLFDADVRSPEDMRCVDHVERMIARDIVRGRRELPAVISASRLEPAKNHVGLLRAYAQSAELQAAANIVIVLHGTEDIHSRAGVAAIEHDVMDEIAAICEANDLWGKVAAFSLDSQHELAAAYRHLRQRHSVFALTAFYEPFGLAPLEAMAAGLPAVVTANGGPSESLHDAATGTDFGILVDPHDPADIAQGLHRLVAIDSEWTRFQRLGRDRVLSRYTWERTAQGYLDALHALERGEQAKTDQPRLPIPEWFENPIPGSAFGLEALERLWPPQKRRD